MQLAASLRYASVASLYFLALGSGQPPITPAVVSPALAPSLQPAVLPAQAAVTAAPVAGAQAASGPAALVAPVVVQAASSNAQSAAVASAAAAASAGQAAAHAAKATAAAVAIVNHASMSAESKVAILGSMVANQAAAQAATAASAATSAAAAAAVQADKASASIGPPDAAVVAKVVAAVAAVTAASAASSATAGLRGALVQPKEADRPSWLEHPLTRMWMMVASATFAAVIKGACLAGNVLVQVSPYPTVKRWESRKCTGEADAAPYISIAYNGWQWCYYGFFAYILTGRSGFLILVQSNCLGAALGSYYAYAFLQNCSSAPARASLQKYLTAAAALAVFQASAALVLPLPRALFLTGIVSSSCSFMGALSMLVTVPTVLRTQNSRSIPGPLVITNFASAIVWTLCGLMLADPLVTGPNVFCVAASAFCIFLRLRYPACDDAGEAGDADTQKTRLLAKVEKVPFAKGQSMQGYGGVPHFGPPKVIDEEDEEEDEEEHAEVPAKIIDAAGPAALPVVGFSAGTGETF